jgi:hypothetical protein
LTYRELSVTVHLEPVGADQVLLVKHRVIRTQEVEILELKKKKNTLKHHNRFIKFIKYQK